MSRLRLALILLILSIPSISQAQAWSNPNAANTLSNISVGVSIGLDVFQDFKSQNRNHAFLISAERLGIKILVAELTKRFIHEDRPDHSDNKSFFSEHTEIATSFSPNILTDLGFTATTGYLRMAADKHHLQDVIVGASSGFLVNHFLPKESQ